MLPLYDRNPTRTTPVVTVLLIAACTVIYFFVQPHNRSVEEARFTYEKAAIPCELVHGRPLAIEELEGGASACRDHPQTPPALPGKNVYLAILYSMFLHGSLLHLGGNMLFLWVFGNNIEDHFGKVKYLLFYLAAGLIATVAQVAVDPNATVPMIGASGAVAGVMGAYLVMFPDVRIHSLIFLGFFVFFRDIAAKWLLGIWFVTQFFTSPNSHVAWMAHVGGFIFGVAVGLVWRARRPRPQPSPATVIYPAW
jgi:membrane associated rhomboid family serine protease